MEFDVALARKVGLDVAGDMGLARDLRVSSDHRLAYFLRLFKQEAFGSQAPRGCRRISGSQSPYGLRTSRLALVGMGCRLFFGSRTVEWVPFLPRLAATFWVSLYFQLASTLWGVTVLGANLHDLRAYD